MTNQENDFPDPVLAPSDIDLIAISARAQSGMLLEKNPNIIWPKLTFFGSKWDVNVLLAAYRSGLFPMPYEISDDFSGIGWWSPSERAIFKPKEIVISTSLRRSMKKFDITVNEDFQGVIKACANPSRPSGWISQDVIDSFNELHLQGYAHSIEVWNDAHQLVGGLYGVEIGGVFAGESMFHIQTDASKVALAHLGRLLDDGTERIIDTQWQTKHLVSMGAKTLSRVEYCRRLPQLLELPAVFTAPSRLPILDEMA